MPETVKITHKDYNGMDEYYVYTFTCPECGKSNIFSFFSFCPHCGVKVEVNMTEEELENLKETVGY